MARIRIQGKGYRCWLARRSAWIHLLFAHVLASYSTYLVMIALGIAPSQHTAWWVTACWIIAAPLSIPLILVFVLVPYALLGPLALLLGKPLPVISLWLSYLGSLIFWSVLVRLYVIRIIRTHRCDLPAEEPENEGKCLHDGKEDGHI